MEENTQRKYDQLVKRRMQEAKEEGVPYVPPKEILKAGHQIMQGGPSRLGQAGPSAH
jgi:hypothetical protein